MIGAGRRNKWITIQAITSVVTAGGETIDAVTTYARLWAAIEPLTAREAWFAQQSQATTTHRITLPYRSGITSRMRALWGGRTFNFDSVVNVDEENRELTVNATEVTA